MKKLTSTELYQYLMNEQTKIQDALNEESEGPSAELRSGAWAMAQRIIEDFGLLPEIEEMWKVRNIQTGDTGYVFADKMKEKHRVHIEEEKQ